MITEKKVQEVLISLGIEDDVISKIMASLTEETTDEKSTLQSYVLDIPHNIPRKDIIKWASKLCSSDSYISIQGDKVLIETNGELKK